MRLVIAILFASCLVAVAAPAAIQHNPWTTTPNDPSVTLQAQQPVSITTTSTVAFVANGLMATTNLDNWLMNVRSFGAVGNGSTDDTTSIQKGLDLIHSSGGGTLVLPIGTFVVDSLVMYTNTSILGTRGKSVLQLKSGGDYILAVNPGILGPINPTNNQKTIVIQGVTFSGQALSGVVDQFRHGLNVNGVSYLTVRDCDFLGIQGDSIYIGSGNVAGHETHNEHILIENCTFDGVNHNNRNGVTIIDGVDVTIRNCVFTRLTAVGMPGCVDIEPDGNGWERISNITIENNTAVDCHGAFGIAAHIFNAASPPHDIAIRNNYFSSTNSIYSVAISVQSGYPVITTNIASMNISIEGNKIYTAGIIPLRVRWVRGVSVAHNAMVGTLYAQLGDEAVTTNMTMDVSFEHNSLTRCGAFLGMLEVGQVDGVKVLHNVFDTQINFGTEATGIITFYGNPGTTTAEHVDIGWNRFIVAPYTNLVSLVWASGCNVDTNSYTFLLNRNNSPLSNSRNSGGVLAPTVELDFDYPAIGLLDTSLARVAPLVMRLSGRLQVTNNIVAQQGTVYETQIGNIGGSSGIAIGSASYSESNPFEVTLDGSEVIKTNLLVRKITTTGFLTSTNLSPSALVQSDGLSTLVSLANQANSVLINNGSQAFWFAGKTTNINVLCEGGVTNQFQFVSGVLSNIVSVP